MLSAFGKSEAPASGWKDITVPLRSGMVHWPGDPPVQIKRITDVARGDSHTLSEITMGSHSGTHIDAPLHLLRAGTSVADMPLDRAIGRARVIEISDPESVKLSELTLHNIVEGERVLFKTRNSVWAWQSDTFQKNFVYISREAAELLAERRVALVGVDYLSVGGYQHDGSEVHRLLLEAGIWIVEGLDLSGVSPGEYDLICLPLKIFDGDGAPARAVLRPARD